MLCQFRFPFYIVYHYEKYCGCTICYEVMVKRIVWPKKDCKQQQQLFPCYCSAHCHYGNADR